ncbi:MAG: hypothetical protein A9Z00_00895 [Thermobacillus sp. ZCTH02-B1]|uniref:carbohydrate ABC transporter permease n=1 Tax=Thermobacillus sp. ZCTH02-B1 TaxID=1858795 RepID=UPI000B568DC9|nr:carbohydrate ABC transporter permease [Thermobacillus sp. ZCTH02-B1]OUM94208.1 MAG: hypothetical protein A9Z00_00895 [Thermobacillus sp. ZCTH02-B1]
MFRTVRRWINLRTISLFVFTVVILVPLLTVVSASLKTMRQYVMEPLRLPSPPTFDNYRDLFVDYGLHRYFVNSLVLTFCTVVLVILFSTMVSYAIVRVGGWIGTLLFGLFSAGLMIPAQVNIIPLYGLVVKLESWFASAAWLPDLKFRDSLPGLIVIEVSILLSISVFIITGFMKTIPRELFEAAAMDGSSEWWMYAKLAVPLSMPSIASAAIFLCVIVWNDLLYPLLFTGEKAKTLTMALMMFRGEYESNFPILFAGVMTVSLPMVLAYLFLQRWFIAGLTSGSLKG